MYAENFFLHTCARSSCLKKFIEFSHSHHARMCKKYDMQQLRNVFGYSHKLWITRCWLCRQLVPEFELAPKLYALVA